MDANIGPSRFSSDTALHDALYMNPRQLVVTDELAQIITQSKSKSGGLVSSAIRQLMEIWGRCNGQLLPAAFSHTGRKQAEINEQRNRKVYQPSLTFVGMSTVKSFFAAVGADAIENGFLNRFLVAVSDAKPQGVVAALRKRASVNQDVPEEVKAWTESVTDWVKQAGGNLAQFDVAGVEATPIVLQFSESAWDYITQFEQKVIKRREDASADDVEEMYNRLVEQAMRIALIVSISLGEREIGFEAARWACQYVEYLSNQTIGAVFNHVAASEFEATCKQVYRVIEQSGSAGMTLRELNKKSRMFRSVDLQRQSTVMNFLFEVMGVVKTERQSVRGRAFVVYVAARHAEDEDEEND
jgi:hypothetical protein